MYPVSHFLKKHWGLYLGFKCNRWSLKPEEDHANLCSIKLVMLNVIITHVKRSHHPTLDADTMCHDCSLWAFDFLNSGDGPTLI